MEPISSLSKIGILTVLAFAVYFAVKRSGISGTNKNFHAKEQLLGSNSAAVKASDFQLQLDKIVEEFSDCCLKYSIFVFANKKHASTQVWEKLFANGPEEFGEPQINLPEVFISGDGRGFLTDWLGDRQVLVGEYDPIGRLLAKHLLAEAEIKAEKAVQQAMAQEAANNQQT